MGINDYLLYFVYAFASIFVIVNPIEATLVFVTLTTGLSSQEKSRIYTRSTLVAFFTAILFAVAGDVVLHIFGITVDSLRVAGGILLFLVAIDMLRGVRQQRKVTEAELRDADQQEDVSYLSSGHTAAHRPWRHHHGGGADECGGKPDRKSAGDSGADTVPSRRPSSSSSSQSTSTGPWGSQASWSPPGSWG